jgi:dachs
MASCYPHRIRFKQFISRYKMLFSSITRISEENSLDDCKAILDNAIEHPIADTPASLNLSWAPGKRHVFLSEGMRQHLENLRTCIRNRSAILIQSVWRGWQIRRISVVQRYKKDMILSPKNVMMNQTLSKFYCFSW